jgi:hypothetical protein
MRVHKERNPRNRELLRVTRNLTVPKRLLTFLTAVLSLEGKLSEVQ